MQELLLVHVDDHVADRCVGGARARPYIHELEVVVAAQLEDFASDQHQQIALHGCKCHK